jgi:hypothetical protein
MVHPKDTPLFSQEQSTTSDNTSLQELAWKMYTEGRSYVHYSELGEIASDCFQVADDVALAQLTRDLATTLPLNRDQHGNYSFLHQSIMEFFVARRLRGVPRTDAIVSELPSGVSGFLDDTRKGPNSARLGGDTA